MTDNDSQSDILSKAEAYTRYGRLVTLTERVKNEDEFYELYLGVARNVLESFPIASSQATSDAVMPDVEEVSETMSEMLPAPSTVFSDDYFGRPTYAIKVLHAIASFYGFGDLPEGFMAHMVLNDLERSNARIMQQVWFARFLGLDPSSARSVIDRFKNARNLPSLSTQSSGEINRHSSAPQAHQPARSHAAPKVDLSTEQFRDSKEHSPSHRGTSPRSARASVPYVTDKPNMAEDTRKATYVHQHFAGRKFTGDLSQSIELLLRDYETCARQHRLTESQKADYLINVLDGPSRTFLLNNYEPGMSYEQVSNIMKSEYNSDSRQLQIQSTLEGLKLGSFMQANSISTESEGMTKVVEYIERLTPQCPPNFRSDGNKIRYLRGAVIGYEWAISPIRNIVTNRYKFNAFVTALHESLQLSIELKSSHQQASHTLVAELTEEEEVEAFFTKYGRHPRYVRKHEIRAPSHVRHSQNNQSKAPSHARHSFNNRNGGSSRTFAESRRRNECFKCGLSWKPGHRCSTGNVTKFVRNRLQNGASHVHIVRDLLLGIEQENQESHEFSTAGGEERLEDTHYVSKSVQELDEALEAVSFGTGNSTDADLLDEAAATHMISAATSGYGHLPDFQ